MTKRLWGYYENIYNFQWTGKTDSVQAGVSLLNLPDLDISFFCFWTFLLVHVRLLKWPVVLNRPFKKPNKLTKKLLKTKNRVQ